MPTRFTAAAAIASADELHDVGESAILDSALQDRVRSVLVDWHARSPQLEIRRDGWLYRVRSGGTGTPRGVVELLHTTYVVSGGADVEVVREAVPVWQIDRILD